MGAIVDPRLPKRPLTPFICYSLERYGSGEYSGIPVSEAMKKISRDYNALPPAQRKVCHYRKPKLKNNTDIRIEI